MYVILHYTYIPSPDPVEAMSLQERGTWTPWGRWRGWGRWYPCRRGWSTWPPWGRWRGWGRRYPCRRGWGTWPPWGTAWFEKVYRTIFQSKGRRLVFKTGVIIQIQNYTSWKLVENIFKVFYIYLNFLWNKNNMIFFVNSIDRWLMRSLLRQLLDK